MLEFSPEALEYIKKKGKSVYLEIPPIINNCCMTIQEKPEVRFGVPYNPEKYEKKEIQGLAVYVPYDLPQIPLTVTLNTFFGIKHLGIEGWRLA
jgi:hypothetical protein